MFIKNIFKFLSLLILSSIFVINVYAESEVKILQGSSYKNYMDFYILGKMDLENTSVKISNLDSKVIDTGNIADTGVIVRTNILIDISTSMPENVGDEVEDLLDTLIENKRENEEYSIIFFGEDINVVQEYTFDRYDLSNTIDKIEYNANESKIYDALYNTIPNIESIDGVPYFYRTIVFTDGIDDTNSGITKEELLLKIQQLKYPIDVIAISEEKQSKDEKELSALTRMSNGKYINIYDNINIEDIESEIFLNEVSWIRVIVPDKLLDGSTRQINISDTNIETQFDMKVLAYENSTKETEVVPVEESETVDEAENTDILVENEESENEENVNGILIIALGITVCILVIIITLKIFSSKRSNAIPEIVQQNTQIPDNTEIIDDKIDTSSTYNNNVSVKIKNKNNKQEWLLDLKNEIVAGREVDCQINIVDKSISRKQFKIYLDNGTPKIENLSSSNATLVNGTRLNHPVNLKIGDNIKCGRIVLEVEMINKSKGKELENLLTEFINV